MCGMELACGKFSGEGVSLAFGCFCEGMGWWSPVGWGFGGGVGVILLAHPWCLMFFAFGLVFR